MATTRERSSRRLTKVTGAALAYRERAIAAEENSARRSPSYRAKPYWSQGSAAAVPVGVAGRGRDRGHTVEETLAWLSWCDDYAAEQQQVRAMPTDVISPEPGPGVLSRLLARLGGRFAA